MAKTSGFTTQKKKVLTNYFTEKQSGSVEDLRRQMLIYKALENQQKATQQQPERRKSAGRPQTLL